MVNSSLQVVGFCLAIVGWALAIVTTFLPTWGINDIQGEVIETVRYTVGLWMKCHDLGTGHSTCDTDDSLLLGVPSHLQGARACVCISVALGFIGVLVGVFGLDCVTMAADNPKLKARMVVVSGFVHVLGGAAIGSAVSWFAAQIHFQYYNQLAESRSASWGFEFNNMKMIYGNALFVGWSSMVISLIAGLVSCCSSWSCDDDDDRGHSYTYNPPRSKPAPAEYI